MIFWAFYYTSNQRDLPALVGSLIWSYQNL